MEEQSAARPGGAQVSIRRGDFKITEICFSFASGHYDVAMWDQGLRHGPATYFHPNGNKEEATYVEGYEEVNWFIKNGVN